MMTPEQTRKLKEYSRAIADILYTEGDLDENPTLESIEKTIQGQIQQHVSPEIAAFFLRNQQEQEQAKSENSPVH